MTHKSDRRIAGIFAFAFTDRLERVSRLEASRQSALQIGDRQAVAMSEQYLDRAYADASASARALAGDLRYARALDDLQNLVSASVNAFEAARNSNGLFAHLIPEQGVINETHPLIRLQAICAQVQTNLLESERLAESLVKHLVTDEATASRWRTQARLLIDTMDSIWRSDLQVTPSAPASSASTSACSSRTATLVLTLAARVLPAGERSRHMEEWRCELHDLAQKSSKWGQMAYVLRTAGWSWSLSKVLRAHQAVDTFNK